MDAVLKISQVLHGITLIIMCYLFNWVEISLNFLKEQSMRVQLTDYFLFSSTWNGFNIFSMKVFYSRVIFALSQSNSITLLQAGET